MASVAASQSPRVDAGSVLRIFRSERRFFPQVFTVRRREGVWRRCHRGTPSAGISRGCLDSTVLVGLSLSLSFSIIFIQTSVGLR